ncbi:MAG: ABC transporter permease [Chloroflexi bacterium]|nr:ABC transporter permease [Chloroflexota bacterium]
MSGVVSLAASLRVWQRNRDVYLSLWRTETVSFIVEPLIVLLAMGYGLGALVDEVNGQSYVQFIAPGLLSTYVMYGAIFECSWGTFVRMQIQRTFDAIIVTPVQIEEVVTGELLWGATRATMAGLAMLVAIAVPGWVDSPLALLVLPIVFLEGLLCAVLAMVYTAVAPHVSSFSYFYSLLVTPMFFFSGVFFPLSDLPFGARVVAWMLPLTHMAEANRQLVTGDVTWNLLWSILYIAGLTAVLYPVALRLMRRRLIK